MNPTGKTKRGQALVEFALLVPVMLLLVIGIAEFGRAWMTENILTGAAREGARFAAVQPSYNYIDIRDRVDTVLSGTGIAPTVNVTLISGPPANSIKVDVTSTYSVAIAGFIPGLPISGSFSLTGTATMRRERY